MRQGADLRRAGRGSQDHCGEREALAMRQGWPKQPGNNGKARVQPPHKRRHVGKVLPQSRLEQSARRVTQVPRTCSRESKRQGG